METWPTIFWLKCGVQEGFLVLPRPPVFSGHRNVLLIRVFKHFELYLQLIGVSEPLGIFLDHAQQMESVLSIIDADEPRLECNYSQLLILSNMNVHNWVFQGIIDGLHELVWGNKQCLILIHLEYSHNTLIVSTNDECLSGIYL